MATPSLESDDESTDDETDEEPEVSEEVIEDPTEEGEEEVESEDEDEGGDEDEDEVDTEEVDMPGDEDGDEDDEDGGGSLLSGSTFGISNKVLLAVGVTAVLLVVILRNWEVETTEEDYSQEKAEQEVQQGGGDAAQRGDYGERDPGGGRRYSEEQADEAINNVFSS